jgi:autotransporter-associated beta strand protein
MISLHAAPISWTGTTGNWSDSTWTGGVPPDAQNAEAVITAAGSVVDLQSTSRTVGSLLIGNTTAVTLNSTGGGNLIFNSSVGNATLAQAAGVNNNTAINAGLTLNSSLDVTANASGSTRHLDLNGKITGSGSLNIKSAVGKVQLNNSTNDFSGGVTIENGASLQVLSAGAYLGTGNFTINGGSIQTAGSGTLNIGGGGTQIWNGNFTTSLGASSLNMGTKAVDLNGGIRTVTITATSNNRTNTVGGVISNGGLVVSHTGSTASLVLTGANTYAGGTTVNTTAILATSATGTFGVGSITVADLATLTLGNNMSIGDTAGLTFGNSTINLNYTGTETVSSLFSSVTSTSMANGIGYTATDLNNFFGGSFFTGTGLITVASVPEPSTYAALLGAFVLGGAVIVRRRRAAGSRL